MTGRDAGRVAGLKIERVNLVERIAGLAFALENQLGAVGTEITLATTPPFKGQLSHAGEKRPLTLGSVRARPIGGEQRGGEQRGGCDGKTACHSATGFSFKRPSFQLRA